jgi:hypothetical protein
MGRQKTLWIDEDCWRKLEQMEGDSISGKVRTAIMHHKMDQTAQIAALKTQIKILEASLQARKGRRTME